MQNMNWYLLQLISHQHIAFSVQHYLLPLFYNLGPYTHTAVSVILQAWLSTQLFFFFIKSFECSLLYFWPASPQAANSGLDFSEGIRIQEVNTVTDDVKLKITWGASWRTGLKYYLVFNVTIKQRISSKLKWKDNTIIPLLFCFKWLKGFGFMKCMTNETFSNVKHLSVYVERHFNFSLGKNSTGNYCALLCGARVLN